MQRYFDKGMVAVLALLVAVIAANAAIAFHNIRDLYEARVLVGQSRQVQAALQGVLSLVKDAETGLRGFLITGEEAYLDPYNKALPSIEAQIARVERMTADNPGQQDRIRILRLRVEERLLELDHTLDTRRKRGAEAARQIVMTDWGRVTMEALRSEVQEMVDEETRVLEARNTASLRSMDIARASALFAALLGIVLVASVVYLMRRNLLARDRASAVLSDQRELFRTTLASLGEGVITIDVQGRVTYLNGAAELLAGWVAAKAVGRPLPEVVRLVDAASRRPVEDSATRALRDGAGVSIAHRATLLAHDGASERPVDDSAAPIRDPAGNVVGAVLVVRDITERKAAEDALIEADRRKDEFLAVLAHELRNPLAPLRNALQVVQLEAAKGAAGREPDARAGLWSMMERQIRQMVRLIDDLLDVSRITRNKLELRKESVDLREVVQAALEMSAPMVARFGHRVAVSLPEAACFIEADRARLVQVVDNLVGNAAKYTPPGGRIAVELRPEGESILVRVTDNGVGIPQEMLERIFDMFTQVDRSLERSRGGLGIGLTLVRRIVELHGGSVVAASEGSGQGSRLTITLPRTEPAAREPEAPEEAPGTRAGGHRILVVDDNEDAADTLAGLLRTMGHEVEVAYDGESALAAAEARRPELVFLDLGMPRLNGYETARRLRERPWGRGVLLVALTGWGQEEDRRRARVAGFDRHLVKPADLAALRDVLRALDEPTAEASHAHR